MPQGARTDSRRVDVSTWPHHARPTVGACVNRDLAVAVRRLPDRNSEPLADVPSMLAIVATVTAVVAGGSPGGNALVTVSWRGAALTANGYHASYTPTMGDRVECHLIDDQLIVTDVI